MLTFRSAPRNYRDFPHILLSAERGGVRKGRLRTFWRPPEIRCLPPRPPLGRPRDVSAKSDCAHIEDPPGISALASHSLLRARVECSDIAISPILKIHPQLGPWPEHSPRPIWRRRWQDSESPPSHISTMRPQLARFAQIRFLRVRWCIRHELPRILNISRK